MLSGFSVTALLINYREGNMNCKYTALKMAFIDTFREHNHGEFKITVEKDVLLDKPCVYVDVIQRKDDERPKVTHSEYKHFCWESIDFLDIYLELTENIEKAFATNTLRPFSYLRDPKFKAAVMEKLS
jgi:hypothetical protein